MFSQIKLMSVQFILSFGAFRFEWYQHLKGSNNFLLQHETSEMSMMAYIVKQIHPWCGENLQPNLIAFFQYQRRLEGQHTILTSDGVNIFSPSQPHWIIVQLKKNS